MSINIQEGVVFWDFDGVIKDSVLLKSDAFVELFYSSDKSITERIRKHHSANGGMSRYEKIPLYLNWSGKIVSEKVVAECEKSFSRLVKDKVIQSDWIPGVENYLKSNFRSKDFFLITATPQQEIEEILDALYIRHFFKEVVGSPVEKKRAIKRILKEKNIKAEDSVMIGDSRHDYASAKFNNISFILRKTVLNLDLQNKLDCTMVDNFL